MAYVNIKLVSVHCVKSVQIRSYFWSVLSCIWIEYRKIQIFTPKCTSDLLNPFLANIPILYPLKAPENQRLSGVSRGYKMGTLAGNGLI